MAGGTTIASSVLSLVNSFTGLFSSVTGNASADATADAGEKVTASDAEAKANKERMAIATKDALQERLSVADSLQAQASNPNNPYYGRPV